MKRIRRRAKIKRRRRRREKRARATRHAQVTAHQKEKYIGILLFFLFFFKTSSPTNPYTKNIGFLHLANVRVFKNCFLLYDSQCLCFVAGCLLLLAIKCKKTMKNNKREEQQERRRKNKKRTHIYEEQQRKQRQPMSHKQRERLENVKNHIQQEWRE